MEKNTVGLKIVSYGSIGSVIKILRKYTSYSFSELTSRIKSNEYILEFNYIDQSGIKRIIDCYDELKANRINAEIFELDDEPTTIDLLQNLYKSYTETSDEIDAEIDSEVNDD